MSECLDNSFTYDLPEAPPVNPARGRAAYSRTTGVNWRLQDSCPGGLLDGELTLTLTWLPDTWCVIEPTAWGWPSDGPRHHGHRLVCVM